MKIGVLSLMGVLVTAGLAMAQVDVPPPPTPAPLGAQAVEEEGVETLTRGPIHEAFANPAEIDPEPSPVVPERPPADVPEQPPEYQPEGNFVWLPGYWEWDDDRRNFLWVTGVWRQPPPGKRWLPGYWQEVDGGFQRVKGFWLDEAVENVTYYEAPPASLEVGPSSPQPPGDNYFWIPGNWSYVNTNYVWQAGYWAPYQENWVWIPARWVWTPAGFVFLPGHWDYRLANRGQIFAPVYFTSTVYTQPGFVYRPAVVIPTSNLFIHLWIRPRFGCYYFGNYYGAQYAGMGFMPWANVAVYQRQRYFYDPFYSYASVHYRRQGVDFIGRVQGWHNYYVDHPEHRSPNTWREQQRWMATRPRNEPSVTTQLAAHTIVDEARKPDAPFKVAKIDQRKLNEQVNHAKQLRDLDNARRNLEREHARTLTHVPGGEVARNRDFDKRDSDKRDFDKRDLDKRDSDKGNQDKTGSVVDRAEKGKKGGETVAHKGNPVNLSLPKVDLPESVRNATRNAGVVAGAGQANNPPPRDPLESTCRHASLSIL